MWWGGRHLPATLVCEADLADSLENHKSSVMWSCELIHLLSTKVGRRKCLDLMILRTVPLHGCRFGEVYRMSLLGYNVHVVNSPDLIKLVLSSPHNVMQYPKAISKYYLGPHMLSQERILVMQGYLRRATVATYTGEKLHNNLSLINQIASEAVDSWLHRKTVNAFDELNKVLTGVPTSTSA